MRGAKRAGDQVLRLLRRKNIDRKAAAMYSVDAFSIFFANLRGAARTRGDRSDNGSGLTCHRSFYFAQQ
jgi:hypothetical protein